jgi:hypothetical protein
MDEYPCIYPSTLYPGHTGKTNRTLTRDLHCIAVRNYVTKMWEPKPVSEPVSGGSWEISTLRAARSDDIDPAP